jgi:uncharacterized RDD family membrane protein YckC
VGDVVAVCCFILATGYMLIRDSLPGGQSYGKRAVETAVVDIKSGEPCTIGKSIIRNAMRLLGIIDIVFIGGQERRRLGDFAAGTLVVKRSRGMSLR